MTMSNRDVMGSCYEESDRDVTFAIPIRSAKSLPKSSNVALTSRRLCFRRNFR